MGSAEQVHSERRVLKLVNFLVFRKDRKTKATYNPTSIHTVTS